MTDIKNKRQTVYDDFLTYCDQKLLDSKIIKDPENYSDVETPVACFENEHRWAIVHVNQDMKDDISAYFEAKDDLIAVDRLHVEVSKFVKIDAKIFELIEKWFFGSIDLSRFEKYLNSKNIS